MMTLIKPRLHFVVHLYVFEETAFKAFVYEIAPEIVLKAMSMFRNIKDMKDSTKTLL